jgi:type II secretory pathway pseudopilin PulG
MPTGSLHRLSSVRARTATCQAVQRGFAYVLLLVTIALISLFASTSMSAGSQMARSGAEQSLLVIGGEFESALRSYARLGNTSPVGPSGPKTLQELLRDPRFPGLRRHLRQTYADPLTGQANWGLVTDPAGFIVAVYSQAEGTPIKQSGFPPAQSHFAGATRYADWIFGLSPMLASSAQTPTQKPAQPFTQPPTQPAAPRSPATPP